MGSVIYIIFGEGLSVLTPLAGKRRDPSALKGRL